MALAAERDTRRSVAEFRAWAEPRPVHERWELIDGEPMPMSHLREPHQQIVSNLIRWIGDLADVKGCRTLPGLAVPSEAMEDFAPIPDVLVRRGPPLPDGCASDPAPVAEVLSPSTTSRDLGRKTDFDRGVPSLRVFLIVYADEPRVEVWRQAASDRAIEAVGPGDSAALPELGGAVPLSDVYRDIAF